MVSLSSVGGSLLPFLFAITAKATPVELVSSIDSRATFVCNYEAFADTGCTQSLIPESGLKPVVFNCESAWTAPNTYARSYSLSGPNCGNQDILVAQYTGTGCSGSTVINDVTLPGAGCYQINDEHKTKSIGIVWGGLGDPGPILPPPRS